MILQLLFSIRRGYVFKLFLFPFLSTQFEALLRFHCSPFYPFQDSAVAKKFISFSKSLSTRNQFQEMVLNFTYRILKKRPDLASYCHHHSKFELNVPFGNRISFVRSLSLSLFFVGCHSPYTLSVSSSLPPRARMYFDFSVFRYRRLSFDFFPIFFHSFSRRFLLI
jgi:hypothetical protein